VSPTGYGEGLPCPTPQHLTIERADPVVWWAAEMFDETRAGQAQHGHCYPVSINGDLITVTASNRTVTYRIGEYDAARHSYLCSWPD
jgi:hypothetical protein